MLTWACVPREFSNVGNGTVNLSVEYASSDGVRRSKDYNLHYEAYPTLKSVQDFLKQEVKNLNKFEKDVDKFQSLIGQEITE